MVSRRREGDGRVLTWGPRDRSPLLAIAAAGGVVRGRERWWEWWWEASKRRGNGACGKCYARSCDLITKFLSKSELKISHTSLWATQIYVFVYLKNFQCLKFALLSYYSMYLFWFDNIALVMSILFPPFLGSSKQC